MFFKNPKIKVGKINKENKLESRRFVTKDGSVLRVNKINNKTNFYSKFFKNKGKVDEILHITPEFKTIIKKYPEFAKNLHEFFLKSVHEGYIFKNENVIANMKPYFKDTGVNHKALFKLEVNFLKENKQKEYFIKFAKQSRHRKTLSAPEFFASKIFEKFGMNTIKPHLTYFKKPNIDVIMYDFSNLLTIYEAKKKGLINTEELDRIYKKIFSLEEYSKELNLQIGSNPGIIDYNNGQNVFIKKEKNEIKLYFTDLFFKKSWRNILRDLKKKKY